MKASWRSSTQGLKKRVEAIRFLDGVKQTVWLSFLDPAQLQLLRHLPLVYPHDGQRRGRCAESD